MRNPSVSKSRALKVEILLAFLILMIPVWDFPQNARQEGVLTGNLFRADGKTPVADATVKIWSAERHKEYSSPTDKGGTYRIAGIEEGWYSVGVLSVLGDYSLKYSLHFNADSMVRFNLFIKEAGVLDGMQLDPATPNGFLSSVMGILAIVLAVLAVILAFAFYLRKRMRIK